MATISPNHNLGVATTESKEGIKEGANEQGEDDENSLLKLEPVP